MLLSSYCLDGKIDEMFNLWTMIFEDLHLNDAHRFALSVIERLRSWKPLVALQESGRDGQVGSPFSILFQ